MRGSLGARLNSGRHNYNIHALPGAGDQAAAQGAFPIACRARITATRVATGAPAPGLHEVPGWGPEPDAHPSTRTRAPTRRPVLVFVDLAIRHARAIEGATRMAHQ